VIASTVLGLEPVDRDALFGDFELVPGSCLLPFRPARQPLRPKPFRAVSACSRLGAVLRERKCAAAV